MRSIRRFKTLKMKAFCVSLWFLLSCFMASVPVFSGQLSPTDTKVLFKVQKLLEHPEALRGWANWTNFCYLPPSASLRIVCSDNRVTVLTVVGNKTPPSQSSFGNFKVSNATLSENFSIDALFTVLAQLSSLKSLELVSLGLWGPLPQRIGHLRSLQILNLSSNSINGGFPSSALRKFTQLQKLDFSGNRFSGKIPSFVFSLPSIRYINLGRNQFRGLFPANASCGKNLNFTDISRNLLTGKLAPCLGSKSSNRSVLFSWNCLSNEKGYLKNQHSFSYCHGEASAVKPAGGSPDGVAAVKVGLILGIVGAGLGFLGVVGLLGLVVLRRIRGRRDRDEKSVTGSPKPVTRRAPTIMAAMDLPKYRVFTLEEIEEATDNFDPGNLIGDGAEGQTYKGKAKDGSLVQIRSIKLKQKQKPHHIETISNLRHRNLLSVLGHCSVATRDAATVFIVLQNASNGSLSLRDHLTDWRKEKLKWPQRLSIGVGIARGVQFLHVGMAPSVFGNDLEAESVVVDESLTAKIGGYNIGLMFKIGCESPLGGIDVSNTRVSHGTPEKDDIYNLGTILAELITGKSLKSTSELNKMKLQLEKSLTDGVSKLQDATDPSIRGSFAFQSLRTVIDITVNCLCKDASKRPSIEDVLWNLQYAVQVQEAWASSGNLSTQGSFVL